MTSSIRPQTLVDLQSKARPYVLALLLSSLFWLLVWYWGTVQSMVAIWQQSETFAHGYVIAPISIWLIWRRRRTLAAIDLRPNLLVLPLLMLMGFGWLLGQLSETGVVQQYCLLLMVPLLVWAILGTQIVRALLFPLFFLLFAVPFGDFLLPPLMEYTANFIVSALRLTGIPVYRDGLFITVPSGNWSVVEACSGLRYLIASLIVGVLYAYLTYRTFWRRVMFVALSVIVPIVANWIRAYTIVMIGHLSDMKYAVGVDHLIYGWIFFGVVMVILFWIGSFWRQDHVHQHEVADPAVSMSDTQPPMTAIMMATVATAIMVVIWPAAAAHFERTASNVAANLRAPSAIAGWQPVAAQLSDWAPRFFNPGIRINQVYTDDNKRVGLYIVYYRNQRPSAKLITSRNVLVSSNDPVWADMGNKRRTLIVNNEKILSIETKLRSRSMQLLSWHWYWVDGQYTLNPYWAKFLQAKSKLFGRGDDAAVIIVYTELKVDDKVAAAVLQDFVNALLPGVTKALHDAR